MKAVLGIAELLERVLFHLPARRLYQALLQRVGGSSFRVGHGGIDLAVYLSRKVIRSSFRFLRTEKVGNRKERSRSKLVFLSASSV